MQVNKIIDSGASVNILTKDDFDQIQARKPQFRLQRSMPTVPTDHSICVDSSPQLSTLHKDLQQRLHFMLRYPPLHDPFPADFYLKGSKD